MKKIYELWGVLLIGVFFIFALIATNALNDDTKFKHSSENTAVKNAPQKNVDSTTNEKNLPREYYVALNKAETYAESLDISKNAIYEQLISKKGDNFHKAAAKYAVDQLNVDWKKNALSRAQSYAEDMDMSTRAIYDQLVSKTGENFTDEEAQYAIDHLQ